MAHLYSLLKCPTCGASPDPSFPTCPGCGRSITTARGNLDLLDDSARLDAERFATHYSELRAREGWTGRNGLEDPSSGKNALWRRRVESMAQAGQILARLDAGAARPVIVDVGSGSGWAARYLTCADVIAIDLVDSRSPWALAVRADMEHLPLQTAVADGVLFAAALHYGALEKALAEAARVLRMDGVLVVVDSPIYSDDAQQAQAVARSATYYLKSGCPELADRYHPINATTFRTALVESGFEIERFEIGSKRPWLWRFHRRPPGTLVVAHRIKGTWVP